MIEIYQVPRISDLPRPESIARGHPDYMQMLEEGMKKVRTLNDEQRKHTLNLSERAFLGLSRELSGIDGITATEHTNLQSLSEVMKKTGFESANYAGLDLSKNPAYSLGIDLTKLTRKGIEQIQKTIIEYHMAFREQRKTIIENVQAINERNEEYHSKLLDLTEIMLLTDFNLDTNEIHFFVPRAEGVYESRALIKHPSDPTPVLRNEYSPEWFSDEKFLQAFKEQSVPGNVSYLIKNPSSLTCLDCMIIKGYERFSEDVINLLPEEIRDLARRQYKPSTRPTPTDHHGFPRFSDN